MANLGKRFGRAAGGAATGALGGAPLGPWGSLAGGILGAAKGFFSGDKRPSVQQLQGNQGTQGNNNMAGNFWSGTPNRFERTPIFNEQQRNVLSQLLETGMNGFQNPSAGFEPIANRARSNFTQQTIPGLAERYTKMGDNLLTSGQFASQLGAAASDLETNLAALEAQYGMQNRDQMLRLLGLGLRPQDEINYFQGEPGAGQQLGQDALKLLGQYGPASLLALAGRKGQLDANGNEKSGARGWLDNIIKILSSMG